MTALLPAHLVHLKAAGKSPNTIKDRERLLLAADAVLPHGIDTPTTAELADFLANPDWQRSTRRTYYSHLAAFYRWACHGRTPHLDWNPCDDLTPPKEPRGVPHPVTDDEVRTALARSYGRWPLIITLAAYSGLRVAELCELRREDVNEHTLTIWHGKGGKTSVLPTHPEIWRMVEPMPPGRLVPLNPEYLPGNARIHFNRIGMPDVHLHRFRHWFATMLLRNGADMRTVQELCRHDTLATTARYTEITDGQRRFAVSTLPTLSNPQQRAA